MYPCFHPPCESLRIGHNDLKGVLLLHSDLNHLQEGEESQFNGIQYIRENLLLLIAIDQRDGHTLRAKYQF